MRLGHIIFHAMFMKGSNSTYNGFLRHSLGAGECCDNIGGPWRCKAGWWCHFQVAFLLYLFFPSSLAKSLFVPSLSVSFIYHSRVVNLLSVKYNSKARATFHTPNPTSHLIRTLYPFSLSVRSTNDTAPGFSGSGTTPQNVFHYFRTTFAASQLPASGVSLPLSHSERPCFRPSCDTW